MYHNKRKSLCCTFSVVHVKGRLLVHFDINWVVQR